PLRLMDIDLIYENFTTTDVTFRFWVHAHCGLNLTGATVNVTDGTTTLPATEISPGVYEVIFPYSTLPPNTMSFTVTAVAWPYPPTTYHFTVDLNIPAATAIITTTTTAITTTTTTAITTTTETTTVTTTPTTLGPTLTTSAFSVLMTAGVFLALALGLRVGTNYRRKRKN
ncbi:MAG: hypothetical protein ACFFBD_17115, partial [Candidatus Hodarchaeota archaeon]